eukprot:583203-Rhodomonas_salina.4
MMHGSLFSIQILPFACRRRNRPDSPKAAPRPPQAQFGSLDLGRDARPLTLTPRTSLISTFHILTPAWPRPKPRERPPRRREEQTLGCSASLAFSITWPARAGAHL